MKDIIHEYGDTIILMIMMSGVIYGLKYILDFVSTGGLELFKVVTH